MFYVQHEIKTKYNIYTVIYIHINNILYFQIWIFGLVERESNTLLLYPVSDRSEETLLPIIERHVEKGLQFSVMDGQHTVLLTISGMSILPFCISTRSKRHTSTRIQRRKWKCTRTELKVLGSMLRITSGRCLEQK